LLAVAWYAGGKGKPKELSQGHMDTPVQTKKQRKELVEEKKKAPMAGGATHSNQAIVASRYVLNVCQSKI
jgi:hypothetical protein